MLAKKKPLGWLAQEAEDGRYTRKNTAFSCHCQAHSPVPRHIRQNFIEKLVSRPFTAKNSLRVDGLLIYAEFLEEAGHAFN